MPEQIKQKHQKNFQNVLEKIVNMMYQKEILKLSKKRGFFINTQNTLHKIFDLSLILNDSH